jgi:hypothetical protein
MRAAARMLAAATSAPQQQGGPDHRQDAGPVSQPKCAACSALEREAYFLPSPDSASGPVVQRKCDACAEAEHLSASGMAGFNLLNVPAYPPGSVPPTRQPGLALGPTGDRSEQEADRVAERVMRMPGLLPTALNEPVQLPVPGNIVQRLFARRAAEEATLRRQLSPATISASSIPPIVRRVLGSQGQPLDRTARTFLEPRFGHDFSQVRIHADEAAAESARSVNALAYTVGRDIVFGAGQYQPESGEGRKLLAHELTHVVQQHGGDETAGVAQSVPTQVQRQAAPAASAPVDPPVFHGIRSYATLSSLPEAGHTRGGARSFPKAGPYLLAPHLRTGSDGTETIVYYLAFNTDKAHDRVEWVVGPAELSAFQHDVNHYAQVANMAYSWVPPGAQPPKYQVESAKWVQGIMTGDYEQAEQATPWSSAAKDPGWWLQIGVGMAGAVGPASEVPPVYSGPPALSVVASTESAAVSTAARVPLAPLAPSAIPLRSGPLAAAAEMAPSIAEVPMSSVPIPARAPLVSVPVGAVPPPAPMSMMPHAAAVASAAMSMAPREASEAERETEPHRVCATEFPASKHCSTLPSGYTFPSAQLALKALAVETGIKNLRIVSRRLAERGPCPGEGWHYGVMSGGDYIASLVSCPCCMDSQTGPVMMELWSII